MRLQHQSLSDQKKGRRIAVTSVTIGQADRIPIMTSGRINRCDQCDLGKNHKMCLGEHIVMRRKKWTDGEEDW